ncbi:hypothetical protein [Thiomonas sp.]|uniref:hypothetical protein n=1 Tax=Thiomonas sp. TaxID=2047785 RepID=UPI002617FD44|nr:hypothetical protein [Thiomonas sp.]
MHSTQAPTAAPGAQAPDRPTLFALARLLQRLDSGPLHASADQYRLVAQRLGEALALVTPDAQLDALLRAFPAAAEVYENARYAVAGLCLAPLQRSAETELAARRVIDAAKRAGPAPNPA